MDSAALVEALARGTDVARLLRRARVLAARLCEPNPGSEVTFAFGDDRASFAAALLATWMRGHVAAVPADATRQCVAPVLFRPKNADFLHDTGVGRGHFVPEILADAPGATPGTDEAGTDGTRKQPASGDEGGPAEAVLLTFAEGASEPERAWTAAELLAEVDAWAARLGLDPASRAAPDGTAPRIACTLAPTSWPSVLLGLFVPLRTGATFLPSSGTVDRPSASEAADRVLAWEPDVAVVPPVQARAMAARSRVGSNGPRQIVSSRGELDSRTRARLAAHFEAATDVAFRPAGEGWRGEVLELRGALLAEPGVVDVAMRPLPAARDERVTVLVAVLVLPRASSEVSAGAAAGSREPLATLEGIARRHETDSLAYTLRVLPNLPRDGNGHAPDAALFLLFGRGRDGEPIVRELDFAAAPRADDAEGCRRYRTTIPERYSHYEGHFPGHPILAGAVQLDRIVLPCLRMAAGGPVDVSRLHRVKFGHRILPGDSLEVVVRRKDETRWSFELVRSRLVCTSGGLVITPPGTEPT